MTLLTMTLLPMERHCSSRPRSRYTYYDPTYYDAPTYGETLQLSPEKQARHSALYGALHGCTVSTIVHRTGRREVHHIQHDTTTIHSGARHVAVWVTQLSHTHTPQAPGIFWRCLCEGHTEVSLPIWWPLAV
jgi:hypothetical protein